MDKLSSFWSKVDELAQFAEPIKRFSTKGLKPDNELLSKYFKSKPKMKTPKGMEWNQGLVGNVKRGVKTSIGNTAHTIRSIKDKGVTNTALDQVRQDLYKEIPDAVTYKKGGKNFVKSKAKFLKDREVQSFTDRGGAIVRKRKVLTPLSVGLGGSGASVAGLSYVAQDDRKPFVDRAGRALGEGALFGLNPAVGMGAILAPAVVGSSKKAKKGVTKERPKLTQEQIRKINNVRVQQQ